MIRGDGSRIVGRGAAVWLAGAAILVIAGAALAGQAAAPPAESSMWDLSPDVWGTLKKGGYTMIPLGLCSVIFLAVVLERFLSLQRKNVLPDELVTATERYLRRGDYEETVRICERFDVPFAHVVRAALSRRHLGIGEMERAMVGTGQHEATVLSRNLRTLGVIANLAPMLGLFGTVVGMIRAFDVISRFGTGNPSLVAAGISEALITTAAGLIIGIPSLAAYHFFRSRGDRFLFEIESIAFELLNILTLQIEPGGGLKSGGRLSAGDASGAGDAGGAGEA